MLCYLSGSEKFRGAETHCNREGPGRGGGGDQEAGCFHLKSRIQGGNHVHMYFGTTGGVSCFEGK